MIIPGTHFNKNHDKLFFYGAYEYMIQHPAGSLQSYFVPTSQMHGGQLYPGRIWRLWGLASPTDAAPPLPT